ncbi:hypothetical protein PG993_001605 [Apiospora rasikravindrae]|uniref:Uncharacterized protein n=1 Tax=Apiospora rasikravindrae TaxID=990691 RepID=A0ABR1UBU3_9PEZI
MDYVVIKACQRSQGLLGGGHKTSQFDVIQGLGRTTLLTPEWIGKMSVVILQSWRVLAAEDDIQ